MTQPHASPFVTELAARLEPELPKLDDERFLQVTGATDLTFHHKMLFVMTRTVQQPGWVMITRNADWYGLNVPGDYSFGGPLDLGPVHEQLLEVGYELPPKVRLRAPTYYAQFHDDLPSVASLAARTLELFGDRDAASVRLDFAPPLEPGSS